MKILNQENIILFIFLEFIFQFQIFPVQTQILNKIIRLAGNPYRYNHFSFNSNGDMFIDTEAYPQTNYRFFFGIKKNGRPYFSDGNGNQIYQTAMEFQYIDGRVEGESCFIKVQSTIASIRGKEFICGVSKADGNKHKTEFYNLDEGYAYSYDTKNLFGDITSHVFSLIPDPLNTDSQFNYFISYIAPGSENFKLYTYKLNFYLNSNSDKGISQTNMDQINSVNQKIISCFFTDNYLYTCFYTKDDLKLTIWVFNPIDKLDKKKYIYNYTEYNERRFYKGIHLKENIGFYAYFKDTSTMPTFSLYQIKNDKSVEVYKSHYNIQAKQSTYYNMEMLNDLIKFNNYTICFVSSTSDQKGLNVLVFNLYDDDTYINIRYFFVNIWEENTIKFFCELRLSLYNNFLVMAFSHCDQEVCEEFQIEGYNHYSSLIFFNYPNINQTTFDVLEYIYSNNINIKNGIVINFEDYMIIYNNLFGYIYKGIRIISYSSEIELLNHDIIIEPGIIIYAGDEIQLKFRSDGFYNKGNYNIEFAFVITESDYGTNNNYMEYIDEIRGNNIKDEQQYFQKYEYIGKYADLNVSLSKSLNTNCPGDICLLCYEDNKDECVTCKYNFHFNSETNDKTCHNFETENIEQIQTTIQNLPETQFKEKTYLDTLILNISSKVILSILSSVNDIIETEIINVGTNISECTNDDILAGKCSSKISNDQIKSIYDYLRSHINSSSSQIISTENVIFQISSLHEQKENNNPNISSIDLGECEKILKNNTGLTDEEDLIVYKIDIKNEDLSATYVQYEIYNPRTFTIMSLDICKNTQIKVNIPVNLDENTQSIYDSLSKSGYNLFNLEDDFYNDICSTYTTENGTDLTLADRKNIIYNTNGNKTMCQEGCIFQSYNIITKKSQCDCTVQTSETITNIDEIHFEDSSLTGEFYNTLNNSNFRVLKCFKLVFSIKGQKKNIGSYLMTVFCLIFIILFLIYIVKESSKIKQYIDEILKLKFDFEPKKGEKKMKFNEGVKIFEKNQTSNNIKSKDKKLKDKKIKNKTEPSDKNKKKKREKTNKNLKSSGAFPPRKKPNKNQNSEIVKFKKNYDNLTSKRSKTHDEFVSKKNALNSKKKKTINIINIEQAKMNFQYNVNNNSIKNTQDYLDDYKIVDINDEQMNNLEYELAVVLDKRTYFQYYFSLLKKKQLLLFAFYPNNDYNLKAVKISLLILSFSLYFTVNGFFFSDETMNKINKDHGKYNFLFQIPQMLYSTLISAVINIILKMLSLSEKQILIIKQEKNYLKAKNISNSIIKCLKIKLAFFFTLCLLLMLFFWYFISCFCSVYKNTQTILITDTLISFALSMIYPFGLNLFPGFLRIPSLRSENKNKKYLYILSGYVAWI